MLLLVPLPMLAANGLAEVDTLRGQTNISDAMLFGYDDCVSEISGEDCRRFNSGGSVWFSCGTVGIGEDRRTAVAVPGWDGMVPDSARLEVYCFREGDAADRRILLYPLTTPFYEGTELDYGVGNYPEPDSGVTWYHAYLDVGDTDSLAWLSAGGDYSMAVACTAIVSDTDTWAGFDHFERILAWWDSTGTNYGCLLINENTFPTNTTQKSFYSSESATGLGPRVILYYNEDATMPIRRRRVMLRLMTN
jgi:hypothetical protein